MTIVPGVRLEPCEIVAPLGAGGMGEIMPARPHGSDGRRSQDSLARYRGVARRARPLRARARHLAALLLRLPAARRQHGGQAFLVMELLEGDTLAVRLMKGPLPLDATLRYATQIADALDAAHRAGIVHRDLKPGNVMLPKSGLKLLDFGLAKETAAMSDTMPTLTSPVSTAGAVAGTLQYMAPEQLEGRGADHRSDIWALGAVIYG
jgi:serine/threonine protein kinase